MALLSEPRYADEDRPRKANRTHRPRRLGHTPSTDGWPTANERRRLAMGCGREDATADLRRVRVPCDCASFQGDDCYRMGTCPARRDGHIGSRQHWRPGWPLSLRLRLAAPAAPQTAAPRRALRRALGRSLSGARTQAALRQQSRAITSNQQHSGALGRTTPSPHAVVLGEGAVLPPLPLTALPPSRPPLNALWRTHEHSGAIIGNQQHSGSTQAALGRPTPSPHAVVLGEGAAASTATDCLAIFTTTLRKPSHFLIARDDAP